LGSVAAVCATLLVAALIVRSGGRSGGASQAGVTPETAEGAAPASGTGEASGGASPQAGEAPAAPGAAAPVPSPAETAEPSFTSEQNRREVTLFFQEATSEYLGPERRKIFLTSSIADQRSEEHTSELQSRFDLVCRLL